jgi:acetylornithine deacetylase
MNIKILNNYAKEIESHLDENDAINTLKSIIQIDSRTNTKDENRIIEYWESRYSELGFENKLHQTNDKRLNLVSNLEFSDKGTTIIFNGHLDTNHIGSGWTTDPFGAEIRNNHIYGLGVSNMKASMAAMYTSAKILKKMDLHHGKIIFTSVLGELQGGVGTKELLRKGLKGDFFINGEPTDLNFMTIHAGTYSFTINVIGETRHLSKRDEAIDATIIMNKILNEIQILDISKTIKDLDEKKLNIVHIGAVKSGLGESFSVDRPPQISDNAIIYGSVRFTNFNDIESINNQIEKIIEKYQKLYTSAKIKFNIQSNNPIMPPIKTKLSTQTLELITITNQIIKKEDPRIGQFSPYSLYGTDAGHIVNKLNIPGFVMGSGGKYNTQPDERVSLEDYINNIKLYCLLSIGLLDKNHV